MLSPRLQKIFDLIPLGTKVADIGTDHGYLAKALLDQRKSPFVIASDINAQPLAHAKTLFGRAYQNQIDFRLGSGLEVLEIGECDTIVIAGMGGYLMRDIIEASKDVALSAEKIIFQPMNNSVVLRTALAAFGFRITDEQIALEGNKFYEIIVAVPGKMVLENAADAIVGAPWARHNTPEFLSFLNYKIRREEKILVQLDGEHSDYALKQKAKSQKLLNELTEIRNECKSTNDI